MEASSVNAVLQAILWMCCSTARGSSWSRVTDMIDNETNCLFNRLKPTVAVQVTEVIVLSLEAWAAPVDRIMMLLVF